MTDDDDSKGGEETQERAFRSKQSNVIVAGVFEVDKTGERQFLGEHQFAALPSVGDYIAEMSDGGTPWLLRVDAIQHTPVKLERLKVLPELEPRVSVYVKMVG
jgi:hypothetical protein